MTPHHPLSTPATTARHVLVTAVLANIALLALGLLAYHTGSPWFEQFVREDGMVEWLQFLGFVALSGVLAQVAVHHYQQAGRVTLAVIGIAGFSAVVALAALEEVSWFQRVIGMQSPEFFTANNRQGETNLHNLAMGEKSLNKLILVKLIFLIGITHNLILPLLARWRPAIRARVDSLGLYLPSIGMSAVYLVLVAASQLLFEHPRKGEFGEAFGAIHYLATAFSAYVLGRGYTGPAMLGDAGDRRRVSALFSMVIVFIVFVAFLLGAGYLATGAAPR